MKFPSCCGQIIFSVFDLECELNYSFYSFLNKQKKQNKKTREKFETTNAHAQDSLGMFDNAA